MDTIYALASARGKAGVAVVRISGPQAMCSLLPVVGSFGPPRVAALRALKDGDAILDHALVICFEQDRSFTGETVVELHLHGSQAIVQAVLALLGGLSGFRLAEAGEFTRRALENGRLDLAQVEGLADLIESETEMQRRQAMRVFSGELGKRSEIWRQKLLRAAALTEAVLDFADEEVPTDVRPEVLALVGDVLDDLRAEQDGYAVAERIRDGFEVAILGAPNAGKSTLLNRLAGRQAAITSEYAGTTRDVIEVRMDLRGLPVTILDTAGLRETDDPIEAIGVARAIERANAADLRVFLLGGEGDSLPVHPMMDDIVVQGKADTILADGLSVSGRTGQGVDVLVDRIASVLEQRAASSATITRSRHRQVVDQSVGALESAREVLLNGHEGDEIVADALRLAIGFMDDLVGRIGVEDLLGEIFASFCIGK